jgi:hypothetical protein
MVPIRLFVLPRIFSKVNLDYLDGEEETDAEPPAEEEGVALQDHPVAEA